MNDKFLITVFSIIGIVGCATKNHENPKQLADYSASKTPLVESLAEEPKDLTLSNALALTLEKNPELKTFSYDERVAEARIIQAKLIPNPEISVSLEDVLGTGGYSGSSQSQSTLQLSQVIELGGKRTARGDVATALRDQFRDGYEIKRVEVLTSLTDKFIRTAADEHLLKLAEKAESLANKSLTNIKKRAEAGGVSELEETKAKVLLARAHIVKEHRKHQLLTSKKELSAFWGADDPKFTSINADLFQNIELPDLETLDATIDQSLEIKRWVNEKRLREAEQRLARAKSIPNVLIGGGPRRIESSNDDTWVFQFSMPLSIFDRNQGGREEAQALTEKVVVSEDATRIRLKTALFGLYQEMDHAKTELDTMKKEIIPEAEKSLKIAQDGYDKGRFSYLDLADAQKTLLEVYSENIEAAYSFHSYINASERLLGVSIKANSKPVQGE